MWIQIIIIPFITTVNLGFELIIFSKYSIMS